MNIDCLRCSSSPCVDNGPGLLQCSLFGLTGPIKACDKLAVYVGATFRVVSH